MPVTMHFAQQFCVQVIKWLEITAFFFLVSHAGIVSLLVHRCRVFMPVVSLVVTSTKQKRAPREQNL